MIPADIAACERWCVSKNKTPLDIYALRNGLEWGASDKRSHSSYGDLDEATGIGRQHGLPVTLHVNAATQGIYVIDIEKTCPEEIRQAVMLSLHDRIEYCERSLSGKGYHLIIRLEENVKLKAAKYKKWFELLSEHHCTFTMDEIPVKDAFYESVDTNEVITDDDRDMELLEFLKKPVAPLELYDFVSPMRETAVADDGSLEEYRKVAATFDGRHADLFNMLCRADYNKTIDSFGGDWSSYEFGYASKLHYLLRRLAADMIDADCNHYSIDMTREQCIMLVFMVLKQSIPPRPKHEEFRNGLPWLLYTSERVYAKTFD